MWDSQVYSDQHGNSFEHHALAETSVKCPGGQLLRQLGTAQLAVWDQVCAFRHTGTSPGMTLAMVALAGSQKLLLAIVALVAVVVFIVWPIVRPKRFNQRALRDLRTQQRLKQEIERHTHD